MLSIIYPYRNRDLQRLIYSFESLAGQTSKDFKVFFVDYGSRPETAEKVKKLCTAYPFITYQYCFTQFQPWNKSRALNSVIKNLDFGFCFVADVDMVFHSKFVEKAIALQNPETTTYFQIGFTTNKDDISQISEERFSGFRKSTAEATGLSMFPVEILQKLRGFDEFFHFWGAEDTDMHNRLRNAGYKLQYYNENVLMLHQWHISYHLAEKKDVHTDLQIKGIVKLNHEHLKYNKQNHLTQVNSDNWGDTLQKIELQKLLEVPTSLELDNTKASIDHFLFIQLPLIQGIHKVKISRSNFEKSAKYKTKKMFNKKVPTYYSLKEINDKLLLHSVAFYRNKPYIYKISEGLDALEFTIKK
ncbi:glycosyl transferase family 2 [Gillisia sp. Hel_I_86]|uniref:glycosyltransferase family 2 protein n=1 Tax=Gillisia sp. Hel_I_86 TaxID=1249981 RepID=UPI00119BC2C9|nr:galactosyltransferase-related protein [Gillisia sp. Hel_I_86]TVZ25568.1 glycosyl transferase family 2 [Gillisia sp. Hel_I_86]